jgi:hypothetical protein
MSDNQDKSIVEFDITDLDSAWAPPDLLGKVKILFCTSEACEIALNVPPAILAKLEGKLVKLRDMQSRMSGKQH